MPKRVVNAVELLPQVAISKRGAERLQSGHVWVYRSDLLPAEQEVAAGVLVRVVDHRKKPLGAAFYSSASQIAVRMLTPGTLTLDELPGLLRQ